MNVWRYIFVKYSSYIRNFFFHSSHFMHFLPPPYQSLYLFFPQFISLSHFLVLYWIRCHTGKLQTHRDLLELLKLVQITLTESTYLIELNVLDLEKNVSFIINNIKWYQKWRVFIISTFRFLSRGPISMRSYHHGKMGSSWRTKSVRHYCVFRCVTLLYFNLRLLKLIFL